jgi:membrane protein DedA with SNARE-associated domain
MSPNAAILDAATRKPAALTTRSILAFVGAAGVVGVLAVGIAAAPDLAGAAADATDSLGSWIYLVVPALVFLETTALAGFVIHGELALMLGGVAAERGDARLLAVIALVWVAAVAGDTVSLLLGRFTGFLRATMPFVAGSSGMPLRRLLPFSAASALVWTATFTVIGYAFAETFTRAGDIAVRIGLATLLLVAVALVLRSRWSG